jgi:soluble lytic murein transglycosylase-like protein
MSGLGVRRAVMAGTLLWIAAAAAGEAEVRLERRADGTLQMVNRGINRPAAASRRSRPELDGLIDTHAQRQGLDPELVRAVVLVESSYNPTARSTKGAMGLMQLMPATASSLQVEDPYDPEENLRGGTIYLRRLLDRYDGDLEMALAGYNAGPQAVDRHRGLPPYPETHEYVDRVLRVFRGEGLDSAPTGARRGKPTFLHRDAAGRLVLSTVRPSGS